MDLFSVHDEIISELNGVLHNDAKIQEYNVYNQCSEFIKQNYPEKFDYF